MKTPFNSAPMKFSMTVAMRRAQEWNVLEIPNTILVNIYSFVHSLHGLKPILRQATMYIRQIELIKDYLQNLSIVSINLFQAGHIQHSLAIKDVIYKINSKVVFNENVILKYMI